ncbi:helix-turn-helix transcriptional regulator [Clostridium sp. ZS2-4]|nr:helix-turn-helix transcriptional regulator [Clostridium sp. ZS2-4]
MRKQRLLKGLSQEELTRYIGVADGTMDTYEFDRAFPSPEKLKKIAECLEVPLEYFFDGYYEFVVGDYGKKIRDWREKNKLTLKEAAMVIGVSEKTWGWWEKGVKWPDRVKYWKLIDAMNKKDL